MNKTKTTTDHLTTASVVSFYTDRISIELGDAKEELAAIETTLRSVADRINLAIETIEGRGRCTPGHQMTLAEIRTEARLANADLRCALDSAQQRRAAVELALERINATDQVLDAITSAPNRVLPWTTLSAQVEDYARELAPSR